MATDNEREGALAHELVPIAKALLGDPDNEDAREALRVLLTREGQDRVTDVLDFLGTPLRLAISNCLAEETHYEINPNANDSWETADSTVVLNGS